MEMVAKIRQSSSVFNFVNLKLVEQNLSVVISILEKICEERKIFYGSRNLTLTAKMNLFQFYQKRCAALGLRPIHSNEKFRLNRKIVVVYIFYWLNIIVNCVSLFGKASTFKQYTDYIYWLAVSSCATISYTVLIYKLGNFFEFFDVCDKIIEKSKCKI